MTPYETEIDAALKYARLPSEQIHPDLLLPYPTRGRLVQVARDYYGEDVGNESARLLPRYGQGHLAEHEVAPLREYAGGLPAITNMLKRKPNHAGRVLQAIAFGSDDMNRASDLARAVLQNPHDGTAVAMLKDELLEKGHPAADAVDWENLGRGLGIEKLVRESLAGRNEHWHDILTSPKYNGRLLEMVRRDNAMTGEEQFPGLTDQEIIDAAHRIHVNEYETTSRHPSHWHRMANWRTTGSLREHSMEFLNHANERWGVPAAERVENAFKYRGPQPDESASE